MTEDFKKWCSNKAGYKIPMVYISRYNEKPLETLIKAMWAINREDSKFHIVMTCYAYSVDESHKIEDDTRKSFWITKNVSEPQALQKALEYIYKKEMR